MVNDWFRLPETGEGTATDPHRPDFHGHDINGWGGNKPHPDGPPKVVARVYGDESTLAALADEPGVQRLNNVPTETLNQMLGQERTAEAWNQSFRVGGDNP